MRLHSKSLKSERAEIVFPHGKNIPIREVSLKQAPSGCLLCGKSVYKRNCISLQIQNPKDEGGPYWRTAHIECYDKVLIN